MTNKRINFWPSLPIAILVAAAIASRLVAGSAENDISSEPAPPPECSPTTCCAI